MSNETKQLTGINRVMFFLFVLFCATMGPTIIAWILCRILNQPMGNNEL